MKNAVFSRFLLLALAAVFTLNFTTDRAGWERLGARRVNYGLDRDEIFVTAKDGIFTALKIKVKRGGINMHRLVVHYGNGQTDEIELRNNFAPGSESRVLDLVGNKRIIQKVVFWYDTKNIARRRAVVELWGRH
ncbi:MAG: hypothetical protein ACK4Q5_12015 [Saprospiraceae bacterium]